jgi:cysteine-rich repeat protein
VCDDGNSVNGDGCDDNCTVSACGNGVKAGTEICDDGNAVSGDGCDSNCTVSACGNGILAGNETCDDGNAVSGDGCSASCATESCGDGVSNNRARVTELKFQWLGFTCSSPNTISFFVNGSLVGSDPSETGCTCETGIASLTVTDPALLASVVAGDNQFRVSKQGYLSWALVTLKTSDGASHDIVLFDPTGDAAATRDSNACRSYTWYADSTVASNVAVHAEQCDDGNAVSGDGCDNNCTLTGCRNGVVTGSEVCDDGNAVNGDGCDNNCTLTGCGNAVISTGEGCDDGNLVSGDGCDANCTVSTCGNGIKAGAEQCDDGNTVSGDGCDANCTPTGLHNGVVTAGEQCDDGNSVDTDGCRNDGTPTTCGDGEKNGSFGAKAIVLDWLSSCSSGSSLRFFIGDTLVLDHALGGTCVCEEQVQTVVVTQPAALALLQAGTDTFRVEADGYLNWAMATVQSWRRADQTVVLYDSGGGGDAEARNPDFCSSGYSYAPSIPAVTPTLEAGPPEECDDGNTTSGDGCDLNCTTSRCGNGIVAGAESCEDGNTTSGDGCSAACGVEHCGDGIVNDALAVSELRFEWLAQQCSEDDGPIDFYVNDVLVASSPSDAACDCAAGIQDLVITDPNVLSVLTPGGNVFRVAKQGKLSWALVTVNTSDGQAKPVVLFDPTDSAAIGRSQDACNYWNDPDQSSLASFPLRGEQCDDGNAINGDGCDDNCTPTACGNRVLSTGEACDDGNVTSGDGCAANCTAEACGDGIVNDGSSAMKLTLEWLAIACDGDGNNSIELSIDGKLAASDTRKNRCDCNPGISTLDVTDARALSLLSPGQHQFAIRNEQYLSWALVSVSTSDGVATDIVVYDPTGSAALARDPYACNVQDYAVEATVSATAGRQLEECDDDNTSSGDGCDANCKVTACGNGIQTSGEACDDGNSVDGDGCDHNCTMTACGNGIVSAGEACDDGNTLSGDGCDQNCTVTACGNGVAAGTEICDDGNAVNGDGCDQNCTVTACGNGVVSAGEACDDGNTTDNDGCRNDCSLASCGDGALNASFVAQAVSLEWLSTCSAGSPVDFYINGALANERQNGGGCDCAEQVQSLTLTDPTVTKLVHAGTNAFDVALSGYVSWAIVTVVPAVGAAKEVVLYDTNGGGDAEARRTNLCSSGYQYGIDPPPVTTTLEGTLEQCDDGNTTDGDGCNADCTQATFAP